MRRIRAIETMLAEVPQQGAPYVNFGVTLEPLTTTLLDHFGVVEVEGPQDFDAVRREARTRQANKSAQEGRLDGA